MGRQLSSQSVIHSSLSLFALHGLLQAIGAVLVAQYVEFAYYGGHGRLDRASKIRMSETRSNTMKYSVKDPLQPTMSEKLGNALSFLLRLGRPARVADEEGSEVEEEEAAIAYYLNEDGKMVYIDDNGNEVELSAEEVQMLTDADKEEASLAGSLEGSQVSGVGSQVSYQSRAASRISEGSNSKANSKDLEMMEVGESGKRKKLTAAEKLRRRKEKLRLAQEAEKKLVEVNETQRDSIRFECSNLLCAAFAVGGRGRAVRRRR